MWVQTGRLSVRYPDRRLYSMNQLCTKAYIVEYTLAEMMCCFGSCRLRLLTRHAIPPNVNSVSAVMVKMHNNAAIQLIFDIVWSKV